MAGSILFFFLYIPFFVPYCQKRLLNRFDSSVTPMLQMVERRLTRGKYRITFLESKPIYEREILHRLEK